MEFQSIVSTDKGFDVTATDGTVTSYVDASTVSTGPVVQSLTDTGLTIKHSDGTTQDFVPAN